MTYSEYYSYTRVREVLSRLLIFVLLITKTSVVDASWLPPGTPPLQIAHSIHESIVADCDKVQYKSRTLCLLLERCKEVLTAIDAQLDKVGFEDMKKCVGQLERQVLIIRYHLNFLLPAIYS